ncbi:MAG: hypothetical protein ACI9S8_002308 [Chlamydiales bacterium]|jgi:hypothetical protein
MPNQQLLKKNLELLGENFNPTLTSLVEKANPKNLYFCKTQANETNLILNLNGKENYFYSQKGSHKEASNWFSQLDLENAGVLFVYGIGLGHYYDVVKPWLEKSDENYLTFIEDDINVLHRLMETEKGSCILQDSQVIIHYIDSKEDLTPQLNPLLWFFALLEAEVSALEFYHQNKEALFEKIHYFLRSRSARLNSIVAEEMRFGVSFFQNFYCNILTSHKSLCGSKLFGKFHNVPAIICGSGPSLKKNFATLKDLSNKALIIAGGSALSTLSFQGLLPHLAAAFGPTALQYDRLKNHQGFETPLFYQNRLFYESCWETHGPQFLINKPESYPIAEWFEKTLGIQEKGETDGGVSILNFCTSLAREFGCNPIIFVGFDLAYTDDTWYSEGVMDSEKESKSTAPSHLKWKSIEEHNDIHGNPIKTTINWMAESEWTENFAEVYSEITVINATEGGLGIKGVPNLTLKEVSEKYLDKELDLHGRLHAEATSSQFPNLTQEKILEELGKMYESLEQCIKISEELLEEILISSKRILESDEITHKIETNKSIELKKSLLDELAYLYILAPLEETVEIPQSRKLLRIKRDAANTSQVKSVLKMIALQAENIVFIKRAAETNQILIEDALTEYEDRGGNIDSFFDEV